MKYFFAVLMASLLWGCTKIEHVEFTGITPGIDDGVFTIKTATDSTIIGENIHGGKFHTTKVLEHPGYYSMGISKGTESVFFDVYLEDGKYTITTDAANIHKYPQIQSSSKLQNELSAYHHMADSINATIVKTINELTTKVKDPKSSLLPTAAYNALVKKLSDAEHTELKSDVNVLAKFVAQYPDNRIALHIMLSMNYEDDPATYYKIYQKLNDADKNSDDGKELGDGLKHTLKLTPGGLAPAIAGTTPDGKPVDIKAMNKKIVLVEFWRTGSGISRTNHQSMILNPFPGLSDNKLGIISVSLDTKRDWWLTAIKQDRIFWTQVSDLKGDDSPNTENWGIHDIPTYYLLDGSGHIIERDIPFGNIDFSITDYLKHH
jgi:hypothetical protein